METKYAVEADDNRLSAATSVYGEQFPAMDRIGSLFSNLAANAKADITISDLNCRALDDVPVAALTVGQLSVIRELQTQGTANVSSVLPTPIAGVNNANIIAQCAPGTFGR